MTENHNATTRRSVLRKGAVTSVALGASVPVYTGLAAASICPRTPGYWKNHDWPSTGLKQVNAKLPNQSSESGVLFASVAEGQEFLDESPESDKGHIMARQLIATILNFQRTGDCYDVDTELADVTGDSDPETFREIKRLSEDWLDASGWDRQTPQETWIVSGAPVEDGEVLKNYLDQFNNNDLLECTCAADD